MMRTLTTAEKDKLQLIDTIILSIPEQHIRDFAEKEKMVSILKGDPLYADGPIMSLYRDNVQLSSELIRIQSELYTVKSGFADLIRLLDRGQFNSSQQSEFQMLKARQCIY